MRIRPLMKLSPVLAIAGLLAASPASALSFGVGLKGGVNFANAAVEDGETEGITGLIAGGMMEFGVTSPFSLVVEALYTQKGADLKGPINAGAELAYLEFPILFKAKFGQTAMHAYAFAGPNIGVKLA